jgi:serine acetyltransferase
VIQNLKIGQNVMVGAGSVVIRDVGAGLTVVGVPAKAI